MESYQEKAWSILFYEFIKQSKAHKTFEEDIVSPLIPNGDSALLLGCAGGRYMEQLCNHFNQVEAIDISAPMIEKCKKEHSDSIVFHQMDLNNPQRINKTFDFILGSFIMHYIKDLNFFLSFIDQNLSETGVGIFTIPHPKYSSRLPSNGKMVVDDWKAINTKMKYFHRSQEEYENYIHQNGFIITQSLSTPNSEKYFKYNWIIEIRKR